jgi:hypothetical protein
MKWMAQMDSEQDYVEQETYWADDYSTYYGSTDVFTELGIEAAPSPYRKFAEGLFYFVIIATTFPQFSLGLRGIPFALGGLVVVSGLLGLYLLKAEGRRLPTSVWFAILINIMVNLSQVLHGVMPILGEGLRPYTHWFARLTLMCYLVQNHNAGKRVLVFLALVTVAVVVSSGGVGNIEQSERLHLKEMSENVNSAFANANALAYMTSITTVALLFWSLRSSKMIRPVLWGLSGFLVLILFMTVSRGGILVFACGMAVLMLTVMTSRGVRAGGMFMVIAGVLGVMYFGHYLITHMEMLTERLGEHSVRQDVYSLSTLKQMFGTLLIGQGVGTKVQSAGVIAHNSFISMHLYFGGIAAWLYLIWLMTLGVRIIQLKRFGEIPKDYFFMLLALYGMSLGCQFFTNQGHMSYAVIYAVAMIERYTCIYSKKNIALRYISYDDDGYY